MKRCKIRFGFVVAFMATVSLAHADEAKDEAIKKDLKRIQGTWKIVALEINGNKAKKEDAEKLTVTYGPNGKWTLRAAGNEVGKGTSTLDPTMKPKTIDFTLTGGGGKGSQFIGIYELGDNSRKLCFTGKDNARPTEFSSESGSGHILVKFERVKSP